MAAGVSIKNVAELPKSRKMQPFKKLGQDFFSVNVNGC